MGGEEIANIMRAVIFRERDESYKRRSALLPLRVYASISAGRNRYICREFNELARGRATGTRLYTGKRGFPVDLATWRAGPY